MAVDGGAERETDLLESQPQHAPHGRGGDPPDLGRRRPSLVEVAQDVLHVLLHLQLLVHPGVPPDGLHGSIEEGDGVYVGLAQSLEEDGHELQHVSPLAATHPVSVVAAVQSVQATLAVQDEGKAGRSGGSPGLQSSPGSLDQVHSPHTGLAEDRVRLYQRLQVADTHPVWDLPGLALQL